MKKLIATGAALIMMCGALTGCGNNTGSASDSSSTTSEPKKDTSTAETTSEPKKETTMDDTGSNNSAGDYVDGDVDGVESAGEDIVNGVGDAAEDIADGVTGNENSTDSASGTQSTTTT